MNMQPLWSLLKEGFAVWVERDAFLHAGALAFYTLFSLAPLVIIVVSIVGVVYGSQAASGDISAAISEFIGPQAAAAVEDAVRRSRVEEAGLLPTLLGFGALVFGATTVFAQMQSSLNQFWGVTAKPTRSGILVFITVRLLSLGMVLIIGFLLLMSFAVSIGISAVVQYARDWIPVPPVVVTALDLALSLLITATLFGLMFKVLPDVQLRWRDVSRSALVTAALFVAGQYLISLYLTRAAPTSTYGAAGSLVMVLFWVYYSALILFLGAAFAKVTILRRDGVVVPKRTAVRTRVVLQEDEATPQT
ncbi:MAG: YihY/virulence factor BrkB family protein [Pseudomonadota bacterium]